MLTIARRFCGPPSSANGGYACGIAAAFIDGAAEVTLRAPPPLDVELAVEQGEIVRLSANGQLVAEARPATLALDVPPPPGFDEAVEAATRYAWREKHPYPTCFVCGPQNREGLGIFPGPVTGRAIAAAPFVPEASLADEHGRVRSEIVWAALDCPSWFGFHCAEPSFDARVLLGRLAARVDERPRAGERCVCVGWLLGREGRKIHCGSALYRDGALLAVGRATWIVLSR